MESAPHIRPGDTVRASLIVPRYGALEVTGQARLRADNRTVSVGEFALTIDGSLVEGVHTLAVVEEAP